MWLINLCSSLILDILFRFIEQNIFNLLSWRYICVFIFSIFYKDNFNFSFKKRDLINCFLRAILGICGVIFCSRSLNFFDMYSLYLLISLLSNINFDERIILCFFLIIRILLITKINLLIFPFIGVICFVVCNLLTNKSELSLIDDIKITSLFSIIFTLPLNNIWIINTSFLLFGFISIIFFYTMIYTIRYNKNKLIFISIIEIICSFIIKIFIEKV